MNRTKIAITVAFLAGANGSSAAVFAQDVISKEIAAEGSYCHIKFPAIRQNTLSGPELDEFGRCHRFLRFLRAHPLGADEIQSQRLQWQHRFAADFED